MSTSIQDSGWHTEPFEQSGRAAATAVGCGRRAGPTPMVPRQRLRGRGGRAAAPRRRAPMRTQTPRTVTTLPSPAVELYRPRADRSARWKSLPRPGVTTRGRKDVDLRSVGAAHAGSG